MKTRTDFDSKLTVVLLKTNFKHHLGIGRLVLNGLRVDKF